ncbi:Cell Wall Hydrolase [Paracoccus halophilus]|uniref:Cell wall hydrolase n=1 Tax=Paracoccus halophilus TaxID=376733 RepID=A0A099F9J6_9RHOB|nr:cell wall hydrolase [Paracoccus halophilus]KGJ06762.1 cell wall hydrolase [Paracoccus halophilus]SFA41738.1 Cell Wall Hydrolase [Paracoccus halophilus]
MALNKSWRARVFVCVAIAFSSLATLPALAEKGNGVNARNKAAATRISQSDLECLSEALYFEARGEGANGQRAVAEVILNRVDHPRFPQTVCAVVNQRGQFTYNKNARIRDKGTYARVRKIAIAALSGAPRTLTNGATYFHTRAVSPSWSRRFERTTRIGAHIFYRSDRRLASN